MRANIWQVTLLTSAAICLNYATIINLPGPNLMNTLNLNLTEYNLEESSHKVWLEIEARRNYAGDLKLPSGFASNFFAEASNNQDISEICKIHAEATILNLEQGTSWALKMLDASAKIPSGILEGDIWWIGSFSECLAIRAHINMTGNYSDEFPKEFQGQYCTARALSVFQIALCVPSSCSHDDVLQILNKLVPTLQIGLNGPCRKEEPVNFDSTAISVITLFSIFGLLVIIGTIYDGVLVYKRSCVDVDLGQHPPDVMGRCLLSFSAYTNSLKLFDTTLPRDTIEVLHGLRFLSITWVILGHSYEFLTIVPLKNLATLSDAIWSVPFQAVANGSFSVDTFFFISGFLVAHGVLRDLSKPGSKFNILKYYLHRYWRLTPVYAMVIAWVAGFWFLMSNGPIWANYEMLQEDCRIYWWRHLLYIQTLFGDMQNCVPVSWYLAADMQMFLISPLIVYFLIRFPKIGLLSWLSFLVATLLVTGLLIGLNDYPGVLVFKDAMNDKLMEMFSNVYVRFYCRMGPYLVGIITAYIIHIKRANLRISKPYVWAGWMAATGLALLLIYGPYPYFTGDKERGPAINIIYGTFARTVWSLSVAWLTYACIANHGGVVKSILSWKLFIPLSRLTYCLYLVHLYVIFLFFLSRENEFYFDHFLVVYFFLASLVLSLGVAFIFSMMFEAPLLQLEKILLSMRVKKSESRERLHINPEIEGTEDGNMITG